MDNITFVETIGTRHTFHCLADGGRPVLVVYVDDVPGASEQLPILIGAVGADPSSAQSTLGVTHADVKPITDPSGDVIGVERRVCVKHIARYVVPRTATLMARIYVPKINVN